MQKACIFVNMKASIEIILHDEIQRLFDNFAESFGVNIIFFSIERQVLKRGLERQNSEFCSIVQNSLYGSSKCAYMDEAKCRECVRTKKIISYQCHAGIEEAVAPIFIKGQLAGYAMIGQFRTSRTLPGKVMCEAAKKGVAAQLSTAFSKLPLFERAKAESMLGLFSTISDYITAKEIVDIKGEKLISRIMSYAAENMERNITLPEAASIAGLSISSVSHMFRRFLNKSFKGAMIELKLDRADEYFRSSPEISIEEAAWKVGYSDGLYFSRLYRKYRGIPPSKAREQLNS
ncbi:MAG: hypothetical protein A2020_03225 [Lentisphaerae bacterium GWF2_45_14]|nr:MAG: hypothetical protein A2020_03225 [Lentisphaerae bacterium GWF2_45_14]